MKNPEDRGLRDFCDLEFFRNSQHQDTDDDDTDEQVGLLGELFLQEDPGQ